MIGKIRNRIDSAATTTTNRRDYNLISSSTATTNIEEGSGEETLLDHSLDGDENIVTNSNSDNNLVDELNNETNGNNDVILFCTRRGSDDDGDDNSIQHEPQLCGNGQDDDSDDEGDGLIRDAVSGNDNNDNTLSLLYYYLYEKTLLPDEHCIVSFHDDNKNEAKFIIKLMKFTCFTYGSIAFMYWLVRFVGWEHDDELKLPDVWTYESTLIAGDIMFFYIVGRLYDKCGVDHIGFIVMVLGANLYSSYITDFTIFQHSFTLYEMHCRWPWQLWLFVIVMIPLLGTVAIVHVIHAYQHRQLIQKTVEMIACFIFVVAPYIGSPYFHLHHWYAGWLVGMHFNYNTWWSRAAMAWCWGCYINGIAVYGRDPVLTCGYALFISQDQRCPYIQCYLKALADPEHHTGHNNDTQAPMDVPDWRNCSSSYKP